MRFLAIAIMIFFCQSAAFGAPLRIGVVITPPFVIKEGDYYTGIAIDLWEDISLELGQPYSYTEVKMDKDHDPFDQLQNGNVDLLIGPFSINEVRYKKVDFTLPFFLDKVIAVSSQNYLRNAFEFLSMFIYSVGTIILFFIALFFIYLNLLWYYERTRQSHVPRTYGAGIAHLFWIHTLPGHRVEIPHTTPGKALVLFKIIAFYVILMVLNAAFFSFMTASLMRYSSPIQNLNDLENASVGAIAFTNPHTVAEEKGLTVTPFYTLKDGINAVKEGKIDAFIDDLSNIAYYLKKTHQGDLSLSQFSLTNDLYSFATPQGSSLTRSINEQLLNIQAKQIAEKICNKYIGGRKNNCSF